MKGEPPRQHTIIPAPIAVHTLTPASGATANVHSPAGTSTEIVPVRKPDRYGNQMGAKNAPMQKVHPNLPGLPEIVFSRSKQQPAPGQNGPGSK